MGGQLRRLPQPKVLLPVCRLRLRGVLGRHARDGALGAELDPSRGLRPSRGAHGERTPFSITIGTTRSRPLPSSFTGLHAFIILRGRTTLELSLYGGPNRWDLGWRDNWRSVMGPSLRDWLLPIASTPNAFADGCEWAQVEDRRGLVGDADDEERARVQMTRVGRWRVRGAQRPAQASA